jgi:hypothetical protein
MKAVLINPTTGEVLRRCEYPRWDMQPVSDPQPNEEWLLVVEGPLPDLVKFQHHEKRESVGGPHPEFPHLNTWQITYTAEVDVDAREQLLARVSWRRWEVETGGVVVPLSGGRSVHLATDATSQGKLTGLLLIASSQPVSVNWKGSDGVFTIIDNADVMAMASAAFGHVSFCERRLLGIGGDDLADVMALSGMVERFWP